jgi:ATP-dependent HslUV protease ATP-binding subunit HslU
MANLTPKQIQQELDRYVVGQNKAKKAVAIALRNRWRRQNVEPKDLREEIYPHNILMVGPTGVGKTEIARRLAKLVQAPFVKVEATKFTEVGYVGRDVDSIIRDLMDIGIALTRDKMRKEVEKKASEVATERILNALVGESASDETKSKFLEKFKKGILDESEVEINVLEAPSNPGMPMFDVPGMPGSQMGFLNLGDLLGKALGGSKTKLMRLKVKDAYQVVLKEESDKLVDEEKLTKESIKEVENNGIVFLDEIDKIASRGAESGGKGEISREGVQRDLLPLLEGSTVSTKYGAVKTDHILFIASGAFHIAKPSDLLPELQGRLPVRVELDPLSEEDLMRILTEPEHSLLKQYKALFAVEGLDLDFVDSGVKAIAKIAAELNREVENIGARRLHTILEKLLENLNFEASDMPKSKIKIDKAYVDKNLAEIVKLNDLSKFIL